ncbi:Uncharacterised protein [Raoultella planticola]|nr:Uncharacterised protein [Raoultella planticola]
MDIQRAIHTRDERCWPLWRIVTFAVTGLYV